MKQKGSEGYEKLDRGFQRVSKWLVYLGACLLIVIMLVAFIDVVIAKLFGSSIQYATEIITYFDVPLAYLGVGYTLLIGQMTSVDILFGKFSKGVQRALNMIYDVIGIAVCAFLGKLAFDNMLGFMASHTLSNPKGGFVLWPFAGLESLSWFVLMIAFAFCFMRYIFAPHLIMGETEKEAKEDEIEHILETIPDSENLGKENRS